MSESQVHVGDEAEDAPVTDGQADQSGRAEEAEAEATGAEAAGEADEAAEAS